MECLLLFERQCQGGVPGSRTRGGGGGRSLCRVVVWGARTGGQCGGVGSVKGGQ